jgi:hypothetical protein
MISTDVSGGNWSHIYWGLNVNILTWLIRLKRRPRTSQVFVQRFLGSF